MALFVIGDLHLSIEGDKSMEKFRGWENYVERLSVNWRAAIKPEDSIVLAGDTSWGMSLGEALPDFRFIDALPGAKYLIKGNHDYWWETRAKMERFFAENGLTTLNILHNSAVRVGDVSLCGTRGWMMEDGKPEDRKITVREAMRLETSLRAAETLGGEKVVFLHYPPIYGGGCSPDILELLRRYGVRRCYYGHIHADGCAHAFNGERDGTVFRLASGDFVNFRPLLVE